MTGARAKYTLGRGCQCHAARLGSEVAHLNQQVYVCSQDSNRRPFWATVWIRVAGIVRDQLERNSEVLPELLIASGQLIRCIAAVPEKVEGTALRVAPKLT